MATFQFFLPPGKLIEELHPPNFLENFLAMKPLRLEIGANIFHRFDCSM